MKVIPVIDLLDGIVVHAKKGERSIYQPIQSQLTPSTQPLDIVATLLDVFPFKVLYIADLDAIQKRSKIFKVNNGVIESIRKCYPELELWVDAGISCIEEINVWKLSNLKIILGTENFAKISDYLKLKTHLKNNFILSLDFFSDGFHGPLELLESSEHWPQDVIVMSLSNIGANEGVNTILLNKIKEIAPNASLYAAGGVRNQEDLLKLKSIAIEGVLIATSLHQKQISKQQLDALK